MSEEAEIQNIIGSLIEQLEGARFKLQKLERAYHRLLKKTIATAVKAMEEK